MTDRRTCLSNGKVAHVDLRGQVEADVFTDGSWMQVCVPITPVLDAPDGNRDREALFGQRMLVLDRSEGLAFGCLHRDGYVGYVRDADLSDDGPVATHRICVARTYAKASPELKAYEPLINLSHGCHLTVIGQTGDWMGIRLASGERHYLPPSHICPIEQLDRDPVAVARLFLGTPYLWGGNSAFGLDCSALVQAALLACGHACPGDSDQQMAALGSHVTSDGDYRPGDLLFWPGHVAIVASSDTLLHANAHHMQVVEEPLRPALRRMAQTGTGPVTAHKRL